MENNIKILFENEHFLAIDKPAGVLVHPDLNTTSGTVCQWFVQNYPECAEIGESATLPDGSQVARPGVVHRIDRDTSGVMLLAKTEHGYGFLKKKFKTRKIQKTYLAFTYGAPKEEFGEIDRPIGRSPKDFRMRSAGRGARGAMREAITSYKVLARENGTGFIKVMPRTGRTHQIRVHLKAINYPIVCDKLYASAMECLLDFSRLALHAYKIEFEGIDGEQVSVKAELPQDFIKAMDILGLGQTIVADTK